MELSVDRMESGIVVVSVSGEVDWDNSDRLRMVLTSLYTREPRALVVDLSGVSYMDSSGIATLVEGLQWSHHSQIPFRLSGVAPNVKDILEMAKLEDLLEVFDTREAALKDLT